MATRAAHPFDDLDPRRICLIKPSALGDVVQTLPLLPVLRERFPRAAISWVIDARLSGLLEGHPLLEELIPFRRRNGTGGYLQLLRRLRSGRFDLVFDLQGLARTAMMTAATRAPWRVGLETAREWAHLACNYTIADTGRLVPAHLRYWRVAEAVGMGDFRRQTQIPLRREDGDWARQRLAEARGRLLAIHPGARWITKRWPVQKFAAVAAKAKRRFGVTPVILGSRSERPIGGQLEHLLRRFIRSSPVINLTGETTLKQLAAVLQRADVLLTNDSGPMHLAAGLGTPVVGIFTCTSPVRSGPPGEAHELVSTCVACAASYRKRCPNRPAQRLACMQELDIERVWNALVRLMKKHALEIRAA